MSEKRFISKDESIINVVTDELVNASSEEGAKILVDWLNELSDKYTEQRKENYGLLDGIAFYKEENASLSERVSDLECENEQLKTQLQNISNQRDEFHRGARENANRVGQLEKENKELQERNNRQCKQLDDLCRLIEEKDWRALSDIMDDFKRNDEQLQKEWKCYE